MTNHQQMHDDIDTDSITGQIMRDYRADLRIHGTPRHTITAATRHILDGIAATIAEHTGTDEIDLYDQLDDATCTYLHALNDARKQLDTRLHDIATHSTQHRAA